jgi:cyclopropane fatty-acyl-phospholipid synthase-like methyltransferase
MDIREKILFSLSRVPESSDYSTSFEWTIDNALSLIMSEYPEFFSLVSGKRVVDYGCGQGFQCIALVKKFDCHAVGIDSNKRTLEGAIELAKSFNLSDNKISFFDCVSEDMANGFDIAISQNSFEHFSNPAVVLDEMHKLLHDSGKILITFGPPWLSPYGSHMHFFCKLPWINIFFPEKTVMKVRSHFRSDGATRYEDVESGLNKMTISKFEHIINSRKMKIESKNYRCVKGLNFLAKVPFLREFFVNRVSVVLSKGI